MPLGPENFIDWSNPAELPAPPAVPKGLSPDQFIPGDKPVKVPMEIARPQGKPAHNPLDPIDAPDPVPTPAQAAPAREIPSSIGAAFSRSGEVYKRTRDKHLKTFSQGLSDLTSPTIGGKLWGALEMLGGGVGYYASPVEASIARLSESVGAAAGLSPKTASNVGEKVGEYGTFALQVPFGGSAGLGAVVKGAKGLPVTPAATSAAAQAEKAIQGVRKSKLGESLESIASPTTVTSDAGKMGEILQDHMGQAANDYWAVDQALSTWRKHLNGVVRADRGNWWDFFERMEEGKPQLDPMRQDAADAMRHSMDLLVEKLQGKGWLQNAREHYVGHIWKDPKAYEQIAGEIKAGKRPFLGSKNFLKSRTYEYIKEARAAGLEPTTYDPVDYWMIKYREMSKFYYGTQAAEEAKAALPIKFYPGERLPSGVVALEDPMFKAILPPAKVVHQALHETAYDPGIMNGLKRVTDWLGVKLETPIRSVDKLLGKSYGYSDPATGRIVSRFGNELQVLEHEVGHALDDKFGLWQYMAAQPGSVWRELGQLSLLRDEKLQAAAANPAVRNLLDKKYAYIQPHQNYLGYILSGKERIANMFHAYWYAPQTFQRVAPNAFKAFDQWLNTIGQVELRGLKAQEAIDLVRPTLRIKGESAVETFETNVPGWRHLGQWGAPEDVARVFNNYIKPGIRDNSEKPGLSYVYDLVRKGGNQLNMLQLGLSGFHFLFTSMDATISETSRALEQAAKGEFGKAAYTFGKNQIPFVSGVSMWRKGQALRKGIEEYFGSEASAMSPEMRRLVEHYLRSGGRPQMDVFYRAVQKGLIERIKDGTLAEHILKDPSTRKFGIVGELVPAAFKLAGAALQDTMYPVMELWVPRLKLGVWAKLAEDELRRNPSLTPLQSRQTMQKIWESVDNRMGQVVYDNFFWNKILKDLAFVAVRSVGWNIGTIRELGGGAVDAGKAIRAMGRGEKIELTRRMSYSIAMPIQVGLYGAVANYLFTGEWPREIKDYFFPRIGVKTARGGEARVPIPSYVKDVLSYNSEPVHTATAKMHPIWEFAYELYSNRDFYGGIIYDPREDLIGRSEDLMRYLGEEMLPFSIRSARKMRKERASIAAQAASFFGLQQAPGYITDPEVSKRWQQRQDMQALRRRMKERATQ